MLRLLNNNEIIAKLVEMTHFDSTTSPALISEMKYMRCKTYKSLNYCLSYSIKRVSTLKS